MKLLTFLGVGKYEQTTYQWKDQTFPTKFSPIASCHFLQPDTLCIFLTEDAEEKVFPEFKQSLPNNIQVIPYPVPVGKDEQELWKIFESISNSVSPNEEVAFDITHGLRSFPLLGLLVAAFLRAGMNVSFKAILYGAFDVGKIVWSFETPMFDLTPMLSLLEWAIAADRFNRTGDSRYLSSLLKNHRKSMALEAGENRGLLEQIGRLGNLATLLGEISQSLQLIRPHQTMQSVASLPERVQKAQPILQQTAATRPFELLLDSIVQSYAPLSHAEPRNPEKVHSTLEVERKMINWYAEHEHWVQAVSVAREWLLSWVMVQVGSPKTTQLSARQRFENVINGEANEYRSAKQSERTYTPVFLSSIPQVETVLSLWLNLVEIRNDIDHAGMREDPKKPENLIEQIQRCIQILNTLPINP